MYVDKMIEFSDGQAVTASALSTNVYDLLTTAEGGNTTEFSPNTRLDVGAGEDLYLWVSTAVLATDVGSDATLTITLETADDAAITVNAEVVYSSGALAFASFAPAGSKLVRLKLPLYAYRRYLAVRFTVGAGPLTAGNFDAFITVGVDANRPYKSGFTVQ